MTSKSNEETKRQKTRTSGVEPQKLTEEDMEKAKKAQSEIRAAIAEAKRLKQE